MTDQDASRKLDRAESDLVVLHRLLSKWAGNVEAIQEALAAMRKEDDDIRDELQLMKTAGVIEVSVRNPRVSEYMEHWEQRAISAESSLAAKDSRIRELEEALDRVTRHLETWAADHPDERTSEIDAAIFCARTVLAREAGDEDHG